MRPSPKITPKLVVAIVEQARIEAAEEAALRVSPPLVLAVLLAGLIGAGWIMARNSWAQEQEPATATPASPAPPSLPQKVEQKPQELPAGAADLPPPVAEAPSGLPPTSPSTPPPALNGAPPGTPPVETDDPEKAVQAFVDQNKKTAQGQLKSLKGEAERLRARLQKVEAGIRRWEALLAAIEKSEAAAKDLSPSNVEPAHTGRPQFRPKTEARDRRDVPPSGERDDVPARGESPPTAPR